MLFDQPRSKWHETMIPVCGIAFNKADNKRVTTQSSFEREFDKIAAVCPFWTSDHQELTVS